MARVSTCFRAFRSSRAAAPKSAWEGWIQRSLKAGITSRIINLGASSNDYSCGSPGLAPFGVHKVALTALTRTLAREEIRHGITVNMVAPGSTEGAGDLPEEQRIPLTRLPLGRRVRIREVVDAVLFLLSEDAGAITGQVLAVNGGSFV